METNAKPVQAKINPLSVIRGKKMYLIRAKGIMLKFPEKEVAEQQKFSLGCSIQPPERAILWPEVLWYRVAD